MSKRIILLLCLLALLLVAGYIVFQKKITGITVRQLTEQPVLAMYNLHDSVNTVAVKKYTHVLLKWTTAAADNPAKTLDKFFKDAQPVLITLEIWPPDNILPVNAANILKQITAGDYNQQFKELFAYLQRKTGTVLLRLLPDMEVYVDEYPWQMQSATAYREAFRHVASLKKQAANVQLVWAPAGYPGTEEYWPGADVVDAVSVTIKGKSELRTDNYPAEKSLASLVERKLHRVRFFDKPVLLLGSDKMPAAQFVPASYDSAVAYLRQNHALVYQDVNLAEQQPLPANNRAENGLLLGLYDPKGKLVKNAAVSVEHLFVNLARLHNGSFKKAFDSVVSRKHAVIVTMEPWKDTNQEKDPELIANILKGKYDEAIKKLLDIISQTNQTVFLRWLHEMEIPITRYPWQSQRPVEYIKAYRYFVHKLTPLPAHIKMVWGPAGDRGSMEYWPGSDVVDYTSIAIYGLPDKNITDHTRQESFSSIFKRKFHRLRFANKPLFITEFGVKGPEKYKKIWMADAAATIRTNTSIIGINYFNFEDSPKAWGDIETPDWSTTNAVFKDFIQQLPLKK
ncbi:MAG: hypothetical protein RL172_1108 [Bacteroidota bacterium]